MWRCVGTTIRVINRCFLSGVALLNLAALNGRAAEGHQVIVSDLIHEIQKLSLDGGEINLVWWMPEQYWQASAAANPNSSPGQVQMIMKLVHPYTIILAASGVKRPFGVTNFKSEAEVRSLVRLKDNAGNIYDPLADDKLDPSLPAMLSLMKPMLSRTAGAMGENMHFYVFTGIRKDGTPVCDALKDGACEVGLGTHVFKWRLPLGSLLAPHICPTCGEKLSGAYNFCPYDGTKLTKAP